MLERNPQTQIQQIEHLPGDILLSLARNESATKEMRKAAIRLMLEKGFPQYKHPELTLLVLEITREREAEHEVEAIVETALESEIPQNPALVASFTTKNLYQEEIRNPEKLSDDALTSE